MYKLTNVIFAKVVFFIIIGIINYEFFQAKALIINAFLIIGFAFVLKKIGSRNYLKEIVFFTFIIYIGSCLHYIENEGYKLSFIDKTDVFVDKSVVFSFEIEDILEIKNKTRKVLGQIYEIKSEKDSIYPNIEAIIYLDTIYKPKIGQVYEMTMSNFDSLKYIKKKYFFDYKTFLKRKKIYYSLYIDKAKLISENNTLIGYIKHFAKKTSIYYSNLIDIHIKAPNNAIAKSILIGVRENIDKDLIEAYSNTGVIHILSVSGTHFAVFFLMVSNFLSLIFRSKNGKMKFFINQLLCFSYALVTGMSPPVLRSFAMLFLYDLQKTTYSKPSRINVVYFTAFIMLIYNTNNLFDIGFVFSFLSVLMLFYFYQSIYTKISFSNIILDYIWKIITASICLFLPLLPFSLFIFGKISILGVLSNILVVPISFLILVIGFIFLFISPISVICAKAIGKILYIIIDLQNDIINFFQKIPFSYIDEIHFNTLQFILFLVLLCSLYFFILQKRKYDLRILVFCFLVFFSYHLFLKIRNESKDLLYLFENNKYQIVMLKKNDKIMIFTDSITKEDKKYKINPFINYYSTKNIKYFNFNSINYIKGINIGILAKENESVWKEKILKNKILVLSANIKPFQRKELIQSIINQKKNYFVLEKKDLEFKL